MTTNTETAIVARTTGTVDKETSLQSQLTTAADELEQFRTAVRAEIIGMYNSNAWCLAGTNSALGDLDLPEVAFHYTGRATITVDITVRNTDSEHAARSWIRGALKVYTDDSDVEIHDTSIDTDPNLTRLDAT